MIELAVLSGKGGTGKTSVVASFAALCDDKVIADCDVDASDLHLVLDPTPIRRERFSGSKIAVIDPNLCALCGRCAEVCRYDAVFVPGSRATFGSAGRGPDVDETARASSDAYTIDEAACEGCGACRIVCPAGAIELADAPTGEWYVSESRLGPLVHARLGIGQEASGKLVTVVRSQAAALAKRRGLDLSIIDGSPGIGCPVIASTTGATLALVVTEPTMSGLHDLKRVAAVADRLRVPVAVAINRCDINPGGSHQIEDWAARSGVEMAGTIPYDDSVTSAQMSALSVVEHSDGPAATAIAALWKRISNMLGV
jgi:MinD superfamily P-loop ATPase